MAVDTEIPEPAPNRTTGRGRVVAAALVVVLLVAAVPAALALLDDDGSGTDRDDDAVATVRAAVGRTVASGSYEFDFDTQQGRGTHFSGHGVVNYAPYAMTTTTFPGSSVPNVVLHVDTTTVWQRGGATVGYLPNGEAPGLPLPDYLNQIVGTIGPGPGALAMIGLASRGGNLNLEEAAVATAEATGAGTVEGVPVTFYDVTIDFTQLADLPDLSDAQREAIARALPLLEQSGYQGTTETIGVDGEGFIRDITSTNHFGDGSVTTRHSVLRNFGCAPVVVLPNQAPSTAPAPECPPAPSTTVAPVTTVSPSTAPTTTAPTSTTQASTTSTTSVSTTSTTTPDSSTTSTTTATSSPP